MAVRTGAPRRNAPPKQARRDMIVQAQQHADAVVQELFRLCTAANSETVRVAAIKELLDRAFGRLAPSASADEDHPLEAAIRGLKHELDAKLDRLARRAGS